MVEPRVVGPPPEGGPRTPRVRRVELRRPVTDLDRAAALAGALLAASHDPLAISGWANRMNPCHFFEIGPTWVVATHYANHKEVGTQIPFAAITNSVWTTAQKPKLPRAADFEWYISAEPDIGAAVSGPTLAKAVTETDYLHELQNLMAFAHEAAVKRLGKSLDDYGHAL